MKWLALLVAVTAIAVTLVAGTSMHVLANLDRTDELNLELLMVGELRQLWTSKMFAEAFPTCHAWRGYVAIGPLLMVSVLGLWMIVWRHRGRKKKKVSTAVSSALALLLGAAPYAVGAYALHDNTVPTNAAPWLQWMLLGPMYAALLALLLATAVLLAPGEKGAKKGKGGAARKKAA